MFIKRKHVQVVFFSSIIIAAVFVSTLIGYSFYVQWKKDSFASRYRHSVYKLTAELFEKNVVIANVNVKTIGNQTFSKWPLIEGVLKNNTNKTITSVLVKITFVSSDGDIAYNDWFYPLKAQYPGGPPLSFEIDETDKLLLPGESISFRHRLRNCPPEVVSQLSRGSNFAKKQPKDKMKLECSVTGLNLI